MKTKLLLTLLLVTTLPASIGVYRHTLNPGIPVAAYALNDGSNAVVLVEAASASLYVFDESGGGARVEWWRKETDPTATIVTAGDGRIVLVATWGDYNEAVVWTLPAGVTVEQQREYQIFLPSLGG